MGDEPKRDRRQSTLVERVAAKAGNTLPAEREIDIEVLIHVDALLGVKDLREKTTHVFFGELALIGDGLQVAVEAKHWRHIDRKQEVGALTGPHHSYVGLKLAFELPHR